MTEYMLLMSHFASCLFDQLIDWLIPRWSCSASLCLIDCLIDSLAVTHLPGDKDCWKLLDNFSCFHAFIGRFLHARQNFCNFCIQVKLRVTDVLFSPSCLNAVFEDRVLGLPSFSGILCGPSRFIAPMEAQYNARNPAVKRLFREAQELLDNPDEDFHAAPLEDNLFEWHFTIRGPADTPFENGLYHGSFFPSLRCLIKLLFLSKQQTK